MSYCSGHIRVWPTRSLITHSTIPKILETGGKTDLLEGDIYGSQLETFFPKYNPLAGQESDAPTLQSAGVAGGNDYTDQVVLETDDKCGNHIILRRGWYNPDDKRPWGYDKIRHKHNIWSLFSIKTAVENLCPSENSLTEASITPPSIERLIVIILEERTALRRGRISFPNCLRNRKS